MKRAIRRKHYHRLKERWKRICINEWGMNDIKKIELYSSELTRTRKPCSCMMCGNPRRTLKEITRQERIANDILKTYIKDSE